MKNKTYYISSVRSKKEYSAMDLMNLKKINIIEVYWGIQYHRHILKAQCSTFDKYIYPSIHHHHQDVTTCPSSPKSPCVKKLHKVNDSQNFIIFHSYKSFFEGGSWLIYHILWKLLHVKQKCDLRDVTMTMFISLWTAQRLTRVCGSGIGGEQVPDCT